MLIPITYLIYVCIFAYTRSTFCSILNESEIANQPKTRTTHYELYARANF